jgi:presequence protease
MTAPVESPSTHPAFKWVSQQKIESLNIMVEEYQHRKTGAMHYHIAAENQENVFLVALRTMPMDDTGVAHILEHTALCGSEKYPVRDPFFMMIRRSLNTFMNAFTSSDWTAYPFASQNRKDFNNLLNVYLDAVFFSRLDPLDFAQEGHRVEFAEADNADSELEYKGVVFNEMKGAMSSPTSTLWQALTHHLFPTNTYHYNSGGEPAAIPDLSHEELLAFYKTHYHPSNATFMTFGDITAAEHQAVFEDNALSRFEALNKTIDVNDEKRYSSPQQVTTHYALDDDPAEKTHIVMSWLLGHCTNIDDLLEAHLMSNLLLDNSASPLLKALESNDVGTSPSPLCGLEDSNKEMAFMCGIEGSEADRTDDFEKLVNDVLEQVAKDGIAQERVDAMLHQLELGQREIGGAGYPYGLQLILSALPGAIHRGDPKALLDIEPALVRLREKTKNPDFVTDMVKRKLLDNPHRVTITMVPDNLLSKKMTEDESAKLIAMKAAMTDEQKQQVISIAKQLKARQEQEDDPENLPKVGLEDVPESVSIATGSIHNAHTHFYAQGTNGLVYQQVITDLPALSVEEQHILPYFNTCITELGCGDKTYLEMQELQSSISGGIHASTSLRGKIDDEQDVSGYLTVSGKALNRNSDDLSQLIHNTFVNARFDETSRIHEIMSQISARKQQSVTDSGHSLAMLAASSNMSPTCQLAHQQRGLAGIKSLVELEKSFSDEAALNAFAEQLKNIHQQLIDAPKRFLLVGEKDMANQAIATLENIWTNKPNASFKPIALDPVRTSTQQLWVTSTQVNFCAKAYPTVPVDHPDSSALAVLGGFLRNGFLHRTVREQGGAYGGGASHDSGSASFRFYSYRDPRVEGTLTDFDRSIEWLLSETHQERQLEEAILGVISSIDKPSSPYGEAQQAFHETLFGRTPEQRQAARKRILKVTIDDLKRVTETYLTADKASTAIVTNKSTLDDIGDLGMTVHSLIES